MCLFTFLKFVLQRPWLHCRLLEGLRPHVLRVMRPTWWCLSSSRLCRFLLWCVLCYVCSLLVVVPVVLLLCFVIICLCYVRLVSDMLI